MRVLVRCAVKRFEKLCVVSVGGRVKGGAPRAGLSVVRVEVEHNGYSSLEKSKSVAEARPAGPSRPWGM